MIVRTWHGIVPIERAVGFRNYLQNTGVAEAKALYGNKGAYIYSQSQGEFEHFFMVSYWDSIEDNKYCLISDPIVFHHEVQKVPSEFPSLFIAGS